MYKDNFISGIITAAGVGSRMESEVPKLELKLKDKPIINYTVEKLYNSNLFDEIILVTSLDLLDIYKERFKEYKNLKVILGGNSREESTYNALKVLDKSSNIVLCHDGARPFVTTDLLLSSLDSAIRYGSGIAGINVKDTIKVVENEIVIDTPPREDLYQIQTPQSFKKEVILKGYDSFFGEIKATDDSSYVEDLGEKVYISKGSYRNIKITTREDLAIGKLFLEDL